MPTPAPRWNPLRLATLALGATALLFGDGGARGQAKRPQDKIAGSRHLEKEAWKTLQYEDSMQCAVCHTSPVADRKQDLVLLAEYAIWKTHDKHAQAFAVLKGVRGKRM